MSAENTAVKAARKPRIKRALAFAALFLAFTAGALQLIDFVLVDDVHSYTRVMLQELYASEQNIDILFAGPSHCYRSVDPAVVSEAMGVKAFNAGTSQQLPDGAYFMLREAAKTNTIRQMYLEVFYTTLLEEKSSNVPAAAYIITDFAKESREKYEYLWNMGGLAALLDNAVPARHNNISPGVIGETWRAKLSGAAYEPGNYEYVTYGDEAYRGDGFVYCLPTTGPETDFTPIAQINAQKPISDFSLEYIVKIADFCRENGIELVLFTAPLPDAYTSQLPNYQSYVDYMTALGESLGFDYWDFCLSRDLSELGYENYMDAHHLNGTGAEVFTAELLRVMQASHEPNFDKNEFFWPQYAQKLQHTPDHTAG